MIRFPRSLVVSVLAAVVVLTAGALPALAKSSTVSTTGNDISWPQCGKTFPSGQAFGIVGVNHGLANNLNSCLPSELSWAAKSTPSNALPKGFPTAALYVNTADPGSVVPVVHDWPTNYVDPNVDPNGVSESPASANADPYGPCTETATGSNTPACAWQYGWNHAIQDMLWLIATAPSGVSNLPSAYWWWLDVETGNTWESGTSGLANNVADLRGMVAALKSTGETVTVTGSVVSLGGVTNVGIYSTSYQWGQITDSSAVGYPDLVGVGGLPDWIPGARALSGAQANCSLAGFTTMLGAGPTITQWFGKPYDGDVACP
jgi:hypothetical protein